MHTTVIQVFPDAPVAPSLCGPCGGRCCQSMPGIMLARDLDPELRPEVLRAQVLALLKTRRWALDFYEGNPFGTGALSASGYEQGFYLRPAVKGKEGRVVDASWGGPCTFHGTDGCELSAAERPSECRYLIPAEQGNCRGPAGWHGKRSGAQAWWPFRRVLKLLARHLDDDLPPVAFEDEALTRN